MNPRRNLAFVVTNQIRPFIDRNESLSLGALIMFTCLGLSDGELPALSVEGHASTESLLVLCGRVIATRMSRSVC